MTIFWKLQNGGMARTVGKGLNIGKIRAFAKLPDTASAYLLIEQQGLWNVML